MRSTERNGQHVQGQEVDRGDGRVFEGGIAFFEEIENRAPAVRWCIYEGYEHSANSIERSSLVPAACTLQFIREQSQKRKR